MKRFEFLKNIFLLLMFFYEASIALKVLVNVDDTKMVRGDSTGVRKILKLYWGTGLKQIL